MKIWAAIGCLVIPLGLGAAETPRAITLGRGACFGACPQYEVTLRSDGTVEYEGRAHVHVVGKRTKMIDERLFNRVWAKLAAIGFWNMADRYDSIVTKAPDGTEQRATATDLPEKSITAKDGERQKRVVDYFGAPPALHELEALIDAVAGTDAWVDEPKPDPEPLAKVRARSEFVVAHCGGT